MTDNGCLTPVVMSYGTTFCGTLHCRDPLIQTWNDKAFLNNLNILNSIHTSFHTSNYAKELCKLARARELAKVMPLVAFFS